MWTEQKKVPLCTFPILQTIGELEEEKKKGERESYYEYIYVSETLFIVETQRRLTGIWL